VLDRAMNGAANLVLGSQRKALPLLLPALKTLTEGVVR
jgi:hypothetical protein